MFPRLVVEISNTSTVCVPPATGFSSDDLFPSLHLPTFDQFSCHDNDATGTVVKVPLNGGRNLMMSVSPTIYSSDLGHVKTKNKILWPIGQMGPHIACLWQVTGVPAWACPCLRDR